MILNGLPWKRTEIFLLFLRLHPNTTAFQSFLLTMMSTPFLLRDSCWSYHFMANRWGNNGNSERLYFLGSKITADGDCSHEIKRRLLRGRKVMTNLDSLLKIRGITLPINVHLVKAMVFPVIMYGCESWTIKKAEC